MDTMDLLTLSQTNGLHISLQSKIPSSVIVPHTTISLPYNFQFQKEEDRENAKIIISELSQKLNAKETQAKGKKLKNKTIHHHGLGANFTYQLPPLNFIYLPKLEEPIYLYSIVITNSYILQKNEGIGILLPFSLNFNIRFKLTYKHTNQNEFCIISNQKQVTLTKEQYNKIMFFNTALYNDIYNLNSTDIKYLVVPLLYNSLFGTYQINFELIYMADNIYNHGKVYDVSRNDMENLKERLFLSKHKSNFNLYELYDIIYPNDNFTSFVDKISMYNDEFKETVKKIYFTEMYKYENIIASELFDCPLLTTCPVLTTFKSYMEKNNLPYGNSLYLNSPFLYVDCPKKSNDITLFIRNNNGSNTSANPCPTTNHLYLHTCFPIEQLAYYFINKYHLNIIIKLPYIFNTFEKLLYPYKFILDYAPSYENRIDNRNFKYFQWALTPPSLLLPYTYDTIETLGDTILKFFVTSELIFGAEQGKSEGVVEKMRVRKINNKYLFAKGKEMKLYKYIISKTNAMNDSTHMEINDKNICDVVEASIAAFYLINKDIKDSYWFIKECNIDDDLKANASEETFKRIQDFYYDFGEIGEEDYKIIQRDISFIEIATQYKIGIYGWDIDNFQKDFSHLESLINYKFKDRIHLTRAFRHLSFNNNVKNDNYEKYELMGDCIVELYVIISIFSVYVPLLYIDDEEPGEDILSQNAKKFDCYKATKIKSFLCSNTFMCKLAYMLTLPVYFQYKEVKGEISSHIRSYLSPMNIGIIINRNLNQYEPPESINPKFMADIFEALIGAVYVDGGLINCFKVLNFIYRPFVIYCILYFEELKYSAINDFSFVCTYKYKVAPEFVVRNENGVFYVDIYLMKKLMYSGKGNSQEEAKANAAILALKDMERRESEGK